MAANLTDTITEKEIIDKIIPAYERIQSGRRNKPSAGLPVLTTDEAIEYLKISKPTFLKYIRLGRIKAIKAGKGWRVLQSELYRFLRATIDIGD